MRALKLVQHMKDNADRMSEGLVQKIRSADRCRELLLRVPIPDHKRSCVGNLQRPDGLAGSETDSPVLNAATSILELNLRIRVSRFSNVFWAVCIAREYLWEYMQQECLLEEPVEFWGGVMLLHSLNQVF